MNFCKYRFLQNNSPGSIKMLDLTVAEIIMLKTNCLYKDVIQEQWRLASETSDSTMSTEVSIK